MRYVAEEVGESGGREWVGGWLGVGEVRGAKEDQLMLGRGWGFGGVDEGQLFEDGGDGLVGG